MCDVYLIVLFKVKLTVCVVVYNYHIHAGVNYFIRCIMFPER